MNPHVARVFFAIKPDNTALIKLNNIAKQFVTTSGGYRTRSDKIHLTLLFIGNIKLDQLAKLCTVANTISANPFILSIDNIGYWKRNQIIYAGSNQPCPELMTLIKTIQDTLSINGFSFDQRLVTPHITLIRKASRPVLPKLTEPISWHVNEWCLVQSKQTNQRIDYLPLDCWPLKFPEPAQS